MRGRAGADPRDARARSGAPRPRSSSRSVSSAAARICGDASRSRRGRDERQGGVPGEEPDRGEPDGGARVAAAAGAAGSRGAARARRGARATRTRRVAPVRERLDQAVDRPFVTVPEPPERVHARRAHVRLGAPEAVHEHRTVVCRAPVACAAHRRGVEEAPSRRTSQLCSRPLRRSRPPRMHEDHDRPAHADQRGAERHRPPSDPSSLCRRWPGARPHPFGGSRPDAEGSRSYATGPLGPALRAILAAHHRGEGGSLRLCDRPAERREEQDGLDLPALQHDRVDVRADPLVAGRRDRHDDPVGARLRRESGKRDLLRRDDRDLLARAAESRTMSPRHVSVCFAVPRRHDVFASPSVR